jgi:cell division septation protein DedD
LEPSLKRRLFIAIIIIALAVIFVPMLFTHINRNQSASSSGSIPPKPVVKVVVQRQPHRLTQEQDMAALRGFRPLSSSASNTTTARVIPQHSSDQQNLVKEEIQRLAAAKKAEQLKEQRIAERRLEQRRQAEQQRLAVQRKLAAEKKAVALRASESSPVVSQLSDQSGHHLITITQQDLGAKSALHVRQADATSANVSQAAQNNLKQAQMMNHAWVVQLGSFNDVVRANRVVKQLKAGGYAAFTYKTVVFGELKHRVYVGPFLSYTQAKIVLANVKQAYHLPGYIHHFNASDIG